MQKADIARAIAQELKVHIDVVVARRHSLLPADVAEEIDERGGRTVTDDPWIRRQVARYLLEMVPPGDGTSWRW